MPPDARDAWISYWPRRAPGAMGMVRGVDYKPAQTLADSSQTGPGTRTCGSWRHFSGWQPFPPCPTRGLCACSGAPSILGRHDVAVSARLEYNSGMPLYEYACQECEREFEALVRTGEIPECPSCHGSNLQRRLSVFAAHTSGAASTALPTAGACGTCGDPRGPGACSIN